MSQSNLLKIHYKRVVKSEEVILTVENCLQYGYNHTRKELEGVEYDVFYKDGDNEENFIVPVIEDGVATTKILHNTYQDYSHIAPPCTGFKVSYADVDKEGSGRNSLTGEMFRERIGNYTMFELTWDLIPNTKEYNNWYKILTQLPPSFNVDILLPSGEIATKNVYRTDISTNLYMFVKNKQIWQGLSTTFVQNDVDKYDDTIEPTLEVV